VKSTLLSVNYIDCVNETEEAGKREKKRITLL